MAANWQISDHLPDSAEHVRNLVRHRDADAVRKPEFRRFCLDDLFHEVDNPRNFDFALVGTAERRRDHDISAQAVLLCPPCNGLPCGNRFGGTHALVFAVVGVARDDDHADFVHFRRERTIEAAFIHDQPDVRHAVDLRKPLDQRLGVRHLRHFLRMNETCDFQARNTGVDRHFDKLGLGLGRENFGLALQAVSWTHLHQGNLFSGHGYVLSSVISLR